MSTTTLDRSTDSPRLDRWRLAGTTLLTYAVGLWIVTCNPFVRGMVDRSPITFDGLPLTGRMLLGILLLIIGSSPLECLIRIAVIAAVIQCLNYAGLRDDDIDMESNRPYVFWRALNVKPIWRRRCKNRRIPRV